MAVAVGSEGYAFHRKNEDEEARNILIRILIYVNTFCYIMAKIIKKYRKCVVVNGWNFLKLFLIFSFIVVC